MKRRVRGLNNQSMSNSIDIETFFQIEDEELKKFAFVSGFVRDKRYIKKVDNDEKIGYYYISQVVKKNNSNAFYIKSNLTEWIVYNKKTKKVKISPKNDYVVDCLKQERFSKSNIWLIERFIRKFTPTLCKKIIEGKITKIADLVSYNKSYVIRKKDLSLQTVYNFMLTRKEYLLHNIEDPENLDSLASLDISEVENRQLNDCGFKYKISEIDGINKKYDEWYSRKSKEYDTFLRSRDGNVGDTDGEKIVTEASDTAY